MERRLSVHRVKTGMHKKIETVGTAPFLAALTTTTVLGEQ